VTIKPTGLTVRSGSDWISGILRRDIMGRGPIVFLVIMAVVAAAQFFIRRRRQQKKDLVGRMSNQLGGLSRSKPVEKLVDDADVLLKEIRKQLKR
jgi:hypothetical protein